uniref:Uncharacterized protein n=1 Tax=Stomoxys calcitrans TaxID=35570 RepID=A0A1I8QBD2_STOCA
MVRPRKTFEDVYGMEAAKGVTGKEKIKSSMQANVQDNGYIITSNKPYNNAAPPMATPPTSVYNAGVANSCRRRSARPYGKGPSGGNGPKYPKAGEHDVDIGRNICGVAPKQSSFRGDNKAYKSYPEASNKNVGNDAGLPANLQQQHQHQHSHHHNHHSLGQDNATEDEDKDDDTEEFFQLIRQTVEKAIGKSISELLNRNFKELSLKVDRLSGDLKNTNQTLRKMQTDLNKKIVHCGEENSRRFNFLCMKSEYDKMFYQQQTMMTSGVVPTNSSNDKKQTSHAKTFTNEPKDKAADVEAPLAPCTCRSVRNKHSPSIPKMSTARVARKSSSDEQNIGQKSSEEGMREIINKLTRFCAEKLTKDSKQDEQPSGSSRKIAIDPMEANGAFNGARDIMEGYHQAKTIQINRQIFDDDEFDMSTDSTTTPRSDDEAEAMPRPPPRDILTVRTQNLNQRQHMGCGDGDDRAGGDGNLVTI